MKPTTYSELRNVEIGTYFIAYKFTKGYLGKNMWVCKIKPYREGDIRVEVVKTIYSGNGMWENYISIYETHRMNDVELSTVEYRVGGEVFIFEKEDYYNILMGDI